MCGIVGIIGSQPAADDLIDALKRLEYRGYDSAGIATLQAGRLQRRRAQGKLENLQQRLSEQPLGGTIGIGHTRWATHGAPTEANAHPHMTGNVAVVHNGIIENYRALKEELIAGGAKIESETDTEIIAHLISRERAAGANPEQAVQNTLDKLEGAFALAILFDGEEDLIIAARQGSPLAIGYGKGAMYLGSDAIALAPLTDMITYLEDGDWAVLSKSDVVIKDRAGNIIKRPVQRSLVNSALIDKGEHRHFMAKEIHEQPEIIGHCLAHYVDMATGQVKLPDFGVDLAKLGRITISACGTAYYAGLVGKYWFEQYARLPVEIDVASELRYREAPLPPNGAALFISQSGETADTLATLRYCKEQSQHIFSIVNAQESSIARESDLVLPILAGPEIGVASTKAFTCQLTVLACMAIAAGKTRGHIDEDKERELVSALIEIPRHVSTLLADEMKYKELAHKLAKARDVLYLGRGINYPIALEGALKLKEISYIHAEGYAAGELKHGPIALIDEKVPVIIVAPKDALFDKTVSNMLEVAARGGKIVFLSDATTDEAGCDVFGAVTLPTVHPFTNPLIYSLPVQLLAYHTAVFMGTDVDQPRNLAKSVTVE